jgi:outer membrane lipoprotein SlyB
LDPAWFYLGAPGNDKQRRTGVYLMRRVRGLGRLGFALCSIAPLLAGCAAHHLPSPLAQTSSLNGRFSTGTVVSVRQVDRSDNDGAVAQILKALGRPSAQSQGQAVELVIRRQDNTVTSIIQPQASGQPSFTPGEKVAIVEAAATVVRPE